MMIKITVMVMMMSSRPPNSLLQGTLLFSASPAVTQNFTDVMISGWVAGTGLWVRGELSKAGTGPCPE